MNYLAPALNGLFIAFLGAGAIALLMLWAGAAVWIVFSLTGNLLRFLGS